MKKFLPLVLFVFIFVSAFSLGTNMSVLGIYTLNLDDSSNFSDVFPIVYFSSEITPKIIFKLDDYITLTNNDKISFDLFGDTKSLRVPRHVYMEYKDIDFDLLMGQLNFKYNSYDFRSDYDFRLGGLRDDLMSGIGLKMKLRNKYNIGGYYDFRYDIFEKKDNDDSFALMFGYDTSYNRTNLYLSSSYGRLNLGLDGYHSIKFDRNTYWQFYYGAGAAVARTDSLLKDTLSLTKELLNPKVMVATRFFSKPYYVKLMTYYNLDSDSSNSYYLDADESATNNPNGKKWLYDLRLGTTKLFNDFSGEFFVKGNSFDDGILTDYITNIGFSLYMDDFTLTYALNDLNGRVGGKQSIVFEYTTYTTFNILPQSFFR